MTFITGSILFSALPDQINTGFLAFSDRVLVWRQPRRTRAAAWKMLEDCWEAAGGTGQTALVPMVRHLSTTLKRMSIVFLVSDFLTDEDLFGGPDLAMLGARHEAIAVIPEDPFERELPPGPGYLTVRDVESGSRAAIDLGTRARRLHRASAQRHREELARALYRARMEHVFVPTDARPLDPLISLLAAKVRR